MYLAKVKPDVENTKELTIIAASGPYIMNGSLSTESLNNLVEVVKAKNANVLILVIKIESS